MNRALQFFKMKNFSIEFCGHILLMTAVFLSALSNIYLKAMQRERIGLLHTMRAEGMQAKEKYDRLQIEHDILCSPVILKRRAKLIGLVDPTIHRKLI